MSASDGVTNSYFLNTLNVGGTLNPSRITLDGNLGIVNGSNVGGNSTSSFIGTSTTTTNVNGSNVYIGNLGSSVYINGFLYTPFSPTSFFSQSGTYN